MLLKSLEKKPDFCSVGRLAGSAGVCVSVGTGGPAPTGVLPTEADSFGDTVDFWREGMDKDLGTVNLK